MKTRTEVLEDIRLKANRDVAEANLRYDIFDKVLTPELTGYCIPAVHIHQLWGTLGGIRWETGRGSTGNVPDAKLLRTLLELYPPEPLVYVRDGPASFRPVGGDWRGEVTAAHPITIGVESLAVVGRITKEVRVMFQWNAYIAPNTLLRFSVVVDGSRVKLDMLFRARSIRWQGSGTETLWWELGSPVPDFPAMITPQNAADGILDCVLSGL